MERLERSPNYGSSSQINTTQAVGYGTPAAAVASQPALDMLADCIDRNNARLSEAVNEITAFVNGALGTQPQSEGLASGPRAPAPTRLGRLADLTDGTSRLIGSLHNEIVRLRAL